MTLDIREEVKQPTTKFVGYSSSAQEEELFEDFNHGNGSGSGPNTIKHADMKLSERSSKSGSVQNDVSIQLCNT